MFNIENPPKVFLSYSWTSPEHEEFVISLATKLRADGIDVVLDKWDLKEGQDKYAFMEQMVTDPSIHRVLIISDKRYAERSDSREGGVGSETQIISPEIYRKADQEKFIPIVTEFAQDGEPYLPTFLKGRIYINLSSEELYFSGYENLVRNIYERPALPKPPLGTAPSYIVSDDQRPIITLHKFETFRDAITKGKKFSVVASREFLNAFLETFDEFTITATDGIDEAVLRSIEDFKPYRDEFIEYFRMICLYGEGDEYYEQAFDFFEKAIGYWYLITGANPYHETQSDNYKFFVQELFIYSMAILIQNRKYDQLNLFLDEKYYINKSGNLEAVDFTEMNWHNIQSLDVFRKRRLNLNQISVTADIMKGRADVPQVPFEEVMQTEFILTLRSLFGDIRPPWTPTTLVNKMSWFPDQPPFGIFVRAEAQRHMQHLCNILNVKSRDELIEKFESANEMHQLGQWKFSSNSAPISFPMLMNLGRLSEI
jgi:hypothetical protein